MKCCVCQSGARPVKFRSSRVQICQWCVTLLSGTPIDPVKINEKFNALIESYIDSLCQPCPFEYYRHQARQKLGFPEHTGFFESIFKSALVEKRNSETITLANQLMASEIDTLNANRSRFREDAIQRALGRNDQPKTATFGYRGWAKTEDLAHPTLVKYINAVNLHLLSGTSKSDRPDPSEWDGLRQYVLEQDRYRCMICGVNPKEKHVHHIIPISKFGSNHPNNLITLCYKCHDKAHPDIKVSQNVP